MKLPPVANTDGVQPQVTYDFQVAGGSFNDQLEIATNIVRLTDLKGSGRVAFTYGSGPDRDKVTRQDWATSESATFAYSPNGAVVIDALKQERRYTLTAPPVHVARLEEIGVETSNQSFGELPVSVVAGAPNRSPRTRTLTFEYDEHGLVKTSTLAGVRKTTNAWKDAVGAPGLVLASTSTAPDGGSLSGGTLTSTFGYATKSFVNSVEMSGAGAAKKLQLPVVYGKVTQAITNNDAIDATLNVDRFGRTSSTTSSGGTDEGGGSSAALQYLDGGPWHARGKLGVVDRAGIKTLVAYPTPARVETTEPERNVTTGPQLQLENEIAYHANGRVKTSKRLLEGRTITESFEYDALGRLTSSKSDGIAIGGTNAVAETKTDYDYAARTIRRTLPGGAEILEKLDGLGRVITRTTKTGSSDLVEEYAYDLAGNLVYASDKHAASAHAYDVHGRAIATRHPDGTKTTSSYDAMGNPTLVEHRDAAGELISRTRRRKRILINHVSRTTITPHAGTPTWQPRCARTQHLPPEHDCSRQLKPFPFRPPNGRPKRGRSRSTTDSSDRPSGSGCWEPRSCRCGAACG